MEERLNAKEAECGERCDLFSIGQSFWGKELMVLKVGVPIIT